VPELLVESDVTECQTQCSFRNTASYKVNGFKHADSEQNEAQSDEDKIRNIDM